MSRDRMDQMSRREGSIKPVQIAQAYFYMLKCWSFRNMDSPACINNIIMVNAVPYRRYSEQCISTN